MTLRTGDEPLSTAAALQRRLWGGDPLGWARFAEPHTMPLFEAMLTAADVRPGCAVLDVGCGSGLLLELAVARGATASGVDVSAGLLAVAADRLPSADLWMADMQFLPFAAGSFDCVVGANAFTFAADPVAALRDAARVTATGGRVVVGMFAEPERCESTAIHVALSALSPARREADHLPYALSAPGNVEAALESVGLVVGAAGEVELAWDYADLAAATRGLMSSAGAARAMEDAGELVVREALARAFAPYTDPAGRIIMHNTFRWVQATKPGPDSTVTLDTREPES